MDLAQQSLAGNIRLQTAEVADPIIPFPLEYARGTNDARQIGGEIRDEPVIRKTRCKNLVSECFESVVCRGHTTIIAAPTQSENAEGYTHTHTHIEPHALKQKISALKSATRAFAGGVNPYP